VGRIVKERDEKSACQYASFLLFYTSRGLVNRLEYFGNLIRAHKVEILISIAVIIVATTVFFVLGRDNTADSTYSEAGTEGIVFARRYLEHEVEGLEDYEEVEVIQVTVYEVVGFRGASRAVVIPVRHNGYPVVWIGNRAFEDNELTGISIPNSVTRIGDLAFAGNRLTGVTIPGSVVSIGRSAFERNLLASASIPNSVVYIGNLAFADNRLTSLTIPNSVTHIERLVFAGNRLTSVTIPDSVIYIGYRAFADNRLASVTIPGSVTQIGHRAFENNMLITLVIPNSVTSIGQSAFERNQLASVTIPASVVSIGDRAFARNQLTTVAIPGSVTSVGRWAFAWNPTLESIRIPFASRMIADRTWQIGWRSDVSPAVVLYNSQGVRVVN